MNYTELLAKIAADIVPGLPKGVTAAKLKELFEELAQFANETRGDYQGTAAPSSNPGTPTDPVYYIATTTGTYTNFGGLAVTASDGLNILSFVPGSGWNKAVVPIELGGVVLLDETTKASLLDQNLSLVNNWINPIKFLSAGIDRFAGGMGISFSSQISFDTIDSVFDYRGKNLRLRIGAIPNMFVFFPKSSFLSNSEFTGNFWLNTELLLSVTKSIRIRLFRVTNDTTETQISTQTISFTAGVAQAVKFSNISLYGTDDPAIVRGFQLRFFSVDGNLDCDINLGRINITVRDSDLIETGIETILNERDRRMQESEKYVDGKNNPINTNISLIDRWDVLKILETGTNRFLSGDGFQPNPINSYELIPAKSIFGYTGFCVKASIGDISNFYYYFDASRFKDHPRFNKNVFINLELLFQETRDVSVRIYRVVSPNTETLISDQTISFVSGVSKIVNINFDLIGAIDPNTILGFELRLFTTDGSSWNTFIQLGRILASVESLPTTELERDVDYPVILRNIEKKKGLLEVSLNNISAWGDSLTASSYPDTLMSISGRPVLKRGFGGQKSFQIRDHFIDDPNQYQNTMVFWLGRNNVKTSLFSIAVLEDTLKVIKLIGHHRFIVLGVLNGNYINETLGDTAHSEIVELEEKYLKMFGERFLNIRRILIDSFDSGYVIKDDFSFTQPSIGSNVSVTFNTTTGLSAGGRIRIGTISSFDEYEIVTVVNSTDLTLKLIESNRISSTQTVANDFFDFGGQESYGFLKVLKKQDSIDLINDIVPSSLRIDNIHLTTKGYDQVAHEVYRKLVSLGF